MKNVRIFYLIVLFFGGETFNIFDIEDIYSFAVNTINIVIE